MSFLSEKITRFDSLGYDPTPHLIEHKNFFMKIKRFNSPNIYDQKFSDKGGDYYSYIIEGYW